VRPMAETSGDSSQSTDRSTIESLVLEGITVICDRYAFSGIAFSASKGLPYEWCRAPDIGLPTPDLTLFLDISPEKAKERGGYGEERYETEGMQRRVRAAFDRISQEMNRSSEPAHGGWITIDAGHERDVVSRVLWQHIEPILLGVDHPIQRLWTDMMLKDIRT
jgi:dTMP kinase